MRARAQGILDQHTMPTCLPGVNPLPDPPSNCVGRGDTTGSLQEHRLKYDELLLEIQSIPHPTQIFHQGHHKALPDLTTWRVIVPGGRERKVMTPHLTSLIFINASMNAIARDGVNPLPIDLLELEVLSVQGVAQQTVPLPYRPLDIEVGCSCPVAPPCWYPFG